MNQSRPADACTRPELHQALIGEEDFTEVIRRELEAHSRSCSACAPLWKVRLELDDYFSGPAESTRRNGNCPKAEELYDFARVPGQDRLGHVRQSAAHRLQIEAHLASCRDCRELVQLLDLPVPSAWSADREEDAEADALRKTATAPPASPGTATDSKEAAIPTAYSSATHSSDSDADPLLMGPGSSKRGKLMQGLVAAAAAAAIVAIVALQDSATNAGAELLTHKFPVAAIMRGDQESPLLHPRGRILLDTAPARTTHPIKFEWSPQEGAQTYRIQLRKHSGGAFDTGQVVWEHESEAPAFVSNESLGAGHYTWELWAVIHGLDQRLGARDIELVEDAELLDQLAMLSQLKPPANSERSLLLLHERGFISDARAFARQLPQSSERDAYLQSFKSP